ncbi:helix-turn-helix domain-containing protein [Acidiferrobacter sp.]|jgi:Fis family transcriptional regulator|uniref:helix-turn-helix domain-containing protein n=1 Tax=Acidiferrobacter sp. TaxID=1872107 RepID=UPI002622A271|nr:helix-turn-helix domain-containing protein [Acidiferrobacter sp.]
MSEDRPAKAGQGPLAGCVRLAVERYFKDLNGQCPGTSLYETVIGEVEAPLIETVMRHVGHNQCQAAKILGINRNTLRKKLLSYGLAERPDPLSPTQGNELS